MPPKVDPSTRVEIMLRVVGGEPAPASVLAPQLGPLGLAPKKVSEDIAKATKDWKGLRISIKLIVQNRQSEVEIIPTTSSLIIRALNEPARDRKKEKNIKHNGNITLDDVIKIAKVMRSKSMAKTFKGTILQVLGTARSIGCTVDGESPAALSEAIANNTILINEEED